MTFEQAAESVMGEEVYVYICAGSSGPLTDDDGSMIVFNQVDEAERYAHESEHQFEIFIIGVTVAIEDAETIMSVGG